MAHEEQAASLSFQRVRIRPESLPAYQLGDVGGTHAVRSIYYIPDYISPLEERQLLDNAVSSRSKWTTLSGRQLQNHGGLVHAKGLVPTPLPSWLEPLASRLAAETAAFGGQAANHVLVNSYFPGEGILPHEDGPAYHPVVCIVSTGAPAVIRFWRKPADGAGGVSPDAAPAASVLLQPRSLLVFADDAYCACLHGIREVVCEALDSSVLNPPASGEDVMARGGRRISFTVRRVLNVCKGLGLLRR